MKKFNISLVAEGLTVYAIERQNGIERHRPEGAPFWSEQRRLWTDAILQGMARLEDLSPDPEWMERFDQRLEDARGCSAVESLPLKEQTLLIHNLSCFISALETAGGDRRRQIAVVGELLDDMFTHLSWDTVRNGLSRTRDQAECTLRRMTAQMPVRFTHIMLGGDAGPHWGGGFVSGAVTDAEAVKRTSVYADAVQTYQEVSSWPALCTVYVGHDLPSALGTVDAGEFDLKIMNQIGDRFLNEQGVRCVGGPYQMTVTHEPAVESDEQTIRVLKIEPGMAPEITTMPNTLDAFQAAVGGYIEAVTLDANAILVCNEEGKLNGLPANHQVGGDTIMGTFLIVGAEDGDFCSLSDEDVAYYAEKFAQPVPSYGAPDEPAQWEFYVL